MSDKATDPPASPAKTNALNQIDDHGSPLDDLEIQHVRVNTDSVGIATATLMMGSSCAAAINGIRKKPFLITSDVQACGDVAPVSTDSTETTVTSAVSTSSVTIVLVDIVVRAPLRNAHALQHPMTTTYTASTSMQIQW